MFYPNKNRSNESTEGKKESSKKKTRSSSKPIRDGRNLFATPNGLGIEDSSVQETKQPVLPNRR